MEWIDEYSCGIGEIDEQHKRLLKEFSVVEEKINNNKGWDEIHHAVIDLKKTTSDYFNFEESLLRMYGIPDTTDHVLLHRNFLIEIKRLEVHALKNSVKTEMIEFLHDWLVKHICSIDRGYAKKILDGASVISHLH